MVHTIRWVVAAMLLVLASALAQAADKTIVVLDASGSMWGQIDGKPKLEIAREALRTVLAGLPADREIGLMAYGHREKGSCEDIELVVPPAAGTAGAIAIAASNLKFLGKTPLTAAVKQAAEALKYTEEKSTVVLITDGLETCNADPCALGKELEQSGVDFTAHVVGFGLTAEEGREVACLAENTGGKYVQASDSEALKTALVETVAAPEPAPAPEPEPAPPPAAIEYNFIPETVLAEGQPLKDPGAITYEIDAIAADGSKGERVTTEYGTYRGNLTPGDYIVKAILGVASVEQKVTIVADKTATPRFILNAGTIVIRPRPAEGAPVDTGAAVALTLPDGGFNTNYGETTIVVPAGDHSFSVKIGEGQTSISVSVKAGETVEKDVIVGVGHLVMNALYAEGGEQVDNSGIAFSVAAAKKKIDGSRDILLTTYGAGAKADLPTGDYVVIADMDEAVAEAPVTIKAGELSEVKVVLNAGVLAVTAPGAVRLEFFSAKKSIDGTRKGFGTYYTAEQQLTLPAGDYAVVATRGNPEKQTEGTATVSAGERTELTVP